MSGRRLIAIGLGALLLLAALLLLFPSEWGRKAWLALSAESAKSAESAESPRASLPNVLFILIDALRADHLGTYGYSRSISQNIDRIAREGVQFDAAISAAPWTVPSVVSIFTSVYPTAHGVTRHSMNATGILSDEQVTLAEMLSENGYETRAIIANPWLDGSYKIDQGFSSYDIVTLKEGSITEEALRWLETERTDPFFLYLHYMDVHGPYHSIPKSYSDHPLEALTSRRAKRMLTRRQRKTVPEYWGIRGDSLGDFLDAYDREILLVDDEVGRLMARTRELEEERDTLVILTSDHGVEFLEHGGWDMGNNLHRENLHVPLIMNWSGGDPADVPSALSPGKRVKAQVRSIDIMPTVLGLLGVELPHPVQGVDLGPLLREEDVPGLPAFSEALYREFDNPVTKSMRNASAKVIKNVKTGDTQVYDLTTDPGEQRDLLTGQRSFDQDLQRESFQLLEDLAITNAENRARAEAHGPQRTEEFGEEQREQLRSLGYLE